MARYPASPRHGGDAKQTPLGIRNLIILLSVTLVLACSMIISFLSLSTCNVALDETEDTCHQSLSRCEQSGRDNVLDMVTRVMNRVLESTRYRFKTYLNTPVIISESLKTYMETVPLKNVYDSTGAWWKTFLSAQVYSTLRTHAHRGISMFGVQVYGAYCPALELEFGCDAPLTDVNPTTTLPGPISSVCEKTCGICTPVESDCLDDPDGQLKENGVSCRMLVTAMGCDMDLSSMDPRAAPGTLVEQYCPLSCDTCGVVEKCEDDHLSVRTLSHGVPPMFLIVYVEDPRTINRPQNMTHLQYVFSNMDLRDDDLFTLGNPDRFGNLRDPGKQCNYTEPLITDGRKSMGSCVYPPGWSEETVTKGTQGQAGEERVEELLVEKVCPGCPPWQQLYWKPCPTPGLPCSEGMPYDHGYWDDMFPNDGMLSLCFNSNWEHPDQRLSSITGRRGVGSVYATLDVEGLSHFMKSVDLPRGSRFYTVQRSPNDGTTEVMVGASHGEAFTHVGVSENVKEMTGEAAAEGAAMEGRDVLRVTDSSDPLIADHSASVLARPGGFSGFDADVLYRYHWDANMTWYFVKVGRIEDEHGLLLWMSLLLPVDEVMQTINRTTRENQIWVAQKKQVTTDERNSNFMTMWFVVAAVVLVLLVITALLTRAIVRPLDVLANDMDKVAKMKFDQINEHRKLSTLYEVADMEESFFSMQKDLKQWRDDEQERRRLLEEERDARIQRSINTAAENVRTLVHPMVLCKATEFVDLGGLRAYETLRNHGKLVFLDTEKGLTEFRKKYSTVFLSHQWLDWGWPDPDNKHYTAMVSAVRQVQTKLPSKTDGGDLPLDELYVWVDFCSIAQEHRGMQALAVSSLPVYSSATDAFVVVVPSTIHAKTGKPCNVESYGLRGWCRAEMLSKVCGSGFTHMYITESEGSLVPFTEQWLDRLSLSVFDGEFSCCAIGHENTRVCDRETLVSPVLGLYWLMLTQAHLSHIRPVINIVEAAKEQFFPVCFNFVSCEGYEEERELFGSLIAAMEKRVDDMRRFGQQSTTASSRTNIRVPENAEVSRTMQEMVNPISRRQSRTSRARMSLTSPAAALARREDRERKKSAAAARSASPEPGFRSRSSLLQNQSPGELQVVPLGVGPGGAFAAKVEVTELSA